MKAATPELGAFEYVCDPDDGKLRRIPIQEFIAEQVKIEFLIDDILRRGWLYSLTGMTGSGKTAAGVTIACHVGAQRTFASKQVQGGSVLYIAGENADEVRERFVVAEEKLGRLINVDVIAEGFLLSARVGELVESIGEHGDVLVIVDTDQAVSLKGGIDENDNAERMAHARELRQLTRATSRPTILDLCHPIKAADKDSLVPRGGGAFLNEVDGNFRLWRTGDAAELFSDPNKFRGAFVSIAFALELLESDRIMDTKGRRILTPYYSVISDEQHSQLRTTEWNDENRLILQMSLDPASTHATWARSCGWLDKQAIPQNWKVSRILKKLATSKPALVALNRKGDWVLTTQGKSEAAKP